MGSNRVEDARMSIQCKNEHVLAKTAKRGWEARMVDQDGMLILQHNTKLRRESRGRRPLEKMTRSEIRDGGILHR